MGLVGPRRADLPDAVHPPTVPPFRTVSNDDSPLDVADLVLIDPPGTGHSRILPDGKAEQFYGTQQDAVMTVTLLQQWIREHARWNSPKYLLSESYGTVRAAVVARLLAGGPSETGNMESITLNGLIQLGQAMDLSESAGIDGAILNALPTLAATACYHKRVAQGCTAQSQVDAARALVSGSYLSALHQGSRLAASERESISKTLSTLIGLSSQFILENDLRIQPAAFAKQLLADQDKEVGLYDGRFTLPLAASGHDPVADDPAMGQYVPAFVAAYNEYARNELGVKIDDEYQAIAFRSVNAAWDYGRGVGAGTDRNTAQDLAVAMRRNPHLRLMIATGYYDLVTTLGSAEYTVAHAGIPLDATVFHLYPAGHMPYLGDESRRTLARDVRTFVTIGAAAPAAVH
jgi:carboxypeptidase C (cathepsin A)